MMAVVMIMMMMMMHRNQATKQATSNEKQKEFTQIYISPGNQKHNFLPTQASNDACTLGGWWGSWGVGQPCLGVVEI